MNEQARTNPELIEENVILKQRIQELEQSESERKQAEEALRDSKEQYQFVVENLKEVVFRTDAEGHWTFLNSAWAEVTGFAVEESLGKVFLEYVYPEDRQLNIELFRPLIERKKDYCRHEIRYTNKEGGFRWIEVWARLTVDERGNATGTAGTLTDITERKQVEEALRKSEELYTKLLATIPDIAVRTDTTGQILFINEAGLKMSGYAHTEILGNNMLSYIAPEDRERAFKNMMLMFEQSINPVEYHLLRKDGSKLLVEVNGNILKNEDGSPYGLVFICRDITKRKRAEEERENLISELEKALSEVKKLSGLIPICASCKNIRDDKGYWNQIESYIKEHSDVEFSHGICPECMKKLYPDIYEKKYKNKTG